MSLWRGCVLLVVCLLVSLGQQAQGRKPDGESKKEPAEPPKARTDRYGDALPAGAIDRLGTTRFRHGNYVAAVLFSPDGKTLASAGGDRTIRLWEVPSGKELRRIDGGANLQGQQAEVRGFLRLGGFAPDGSSLAVVLDQGQAVILEVTTGKQLHKIPLQQAQGVPSTVVLAPDGKTLALSNGTNGVAIHDVVTGKIQRQFSDTQGPIMAIAYSPDGTVLATGDGGTVRLWEATTGKALRKLRRHQGPVTTLAFSADGKTLASGADEDSTIRLWDVATGQHLLSFSHRQTVQLDASASGVFEQQIAATRVVFSPDGKTLLSTGKCDRMIRLWEAATGNELRQFEGHASGVAAIALSPDGKTLAAGSEDNSVRLWDVATGKPVGPPDEHRSRLYYLTFAGDGKHLISASRDGTVRRWEMATRKQVGIFEKKEDRPFRVAVAPDGKTLAGGRGDDDTIYLWDLATGKEIRQLTGPRGGVAGLSFSGDGKFLAAVSNSNQAAVWEVAAGTLRSKFGQQNPEGGGTPTVAISRDGKVVAWMMRPNVIGLGDAIAGTELRKIETGSEQAGNIFRLFFSPDGKFIASVADDNTVSLWSTANGRRLHRLDNLGTISVEGMMIMESAAFSADGKLLATVGQDNQVHLWEVATGKEIRRYKGHQGWVSAVAFAPDGRTLLSGSLDTTMLLWDVTGVSPEGRLAVRDLEANEAKTLWNDLAGADAPRAHRAIWTLAAASKQALPFLREQLRPASTIEPERISQFISDLDSEDFTTRQKAFRELEQLGELAEPALRKALADKPSLEVRQRIEQLLAKQDDTSFSESRLRERRAVTALEQMGTGEARQLLEALAKGAEGAYLTREAKAALERLLRGVSMP